MYLIQAIKKYLLGLLFPLAFNNAIIAQDFKAFIEGPFFEHCSKIKVIENNKLLLLQNVMEPPVAGFTTTNTDIASSSFSQICLSNFDGLILKCLAFPDNDSAYYFAEYFEILENGKIAIGGTINPPNNSSTPFFAITNQELNSFEVIKHIDTLQNFTASFNTINDNIIISDQNILLEYNTLGTLINYYDFNSDTISTNPFSWDKNFFNFNNKLYYHFQKISINQDKNFLAFLDDNYIIESKHSNIFEDRPNQYSISLAKRGVKLNSNNYIISGILRNSNISSNVFPSLFKLNSSEQFEILFVDSTIEKFGNTPLFLENQIDFFDENNIYVSFPISNNIEEGLVVYSIKNDGQLNWKQKILLNNNLEYPYNTSILSNTLAVNDFKEIFLTIEVQDAFNKKDIYIIKLDSLGNPIDLGTGIFSLAPKIEINDFLLYPNPVENKLNISTALKESFKLKVFDVLGRIISNTSFENKSSINFEKIDKGNYYYSITNKDGTHIQKGKFLKE